VKADPEQEQEWLRQLSLIYSGLIGIGVVMVQPFLTAASLDLSAKICVVAFSVAIPLLAALVIVNRQEAFRRRMTKSVSVAIAQVVARTSAGVGVVAGFWHILWIAGVGMLDELELDGTGSAWFGEVVSLRWVLIHMVEETARHAGHVDIVRELIDGMTGDHRPA